MRFIVKGNEPASFTEWKALANENWQPTFDLLANPVKRDLCDALKREQGFICCYCERELSAKDYHIEHLNPQSVHDGDDLDYQNLLCSCLNKTAKGAPLHCGKAKDDNRLPIHPLMENCQQYFIFEGNGKITSDDDQAKETIQLLKLDLGKLNDLRKGVLEPFLEQELSDQDFENFVKGYLEGDDKPAPFASAIEYIFRDFL